MEIFGVPETKNEDVLETVKAVGRAMDMNIDNLMVDACHRLPKRPDQPHGGIIVKFVRRFDKEDFMFRRRVKRNLSTKHMGLSGENIIYINESLSPEKKKLLALSRNFKREHGYKFLWVRNGVIKLRKSEGSNIYIINDSNDLRKLS